MFGIGIGELIVIALVALVLVGPKKLPDLMKQAGKFFVQMRRTANDVKSTFDDFVKEAENELRQEEIEQLKVVLGKQNQELKAIEAGVLGQSTYGDDQGGHPHDHLDSSHYDPHHHDPHLHGDTHHHDHSHHDPDHAGGSPPGAIAFDPSEQSPQLDQQPQPQGEIPKKAQEPI